jgi:formate hydrogenlyase subunit 6/NADH:ubiquinone oxidoreductase subunit I
VESKRADFGPIAVVRAVAKAMWVTLLNLFRKPVTVHYPDVQRAYPDRYRGLLALVRIRLPAGGDQGRNAQE